MANYPATYIDLIRGYVFECALWKQTAFWKIGNFCKLIFRTLCGLESLILTVSWKSAENYDSIDLTLFDSGQLKALYQLTTRLQVAILDASNGFTERLQKVFALRFVNSVDFKLNDVKINV